ncbi:serine/threonine protein phosphatase PrpC [Herbihabitans rhizosphaerae]|uniref:Serine/threonine protein phosphatase PrpC n=1 Tax=Herbihabitans rhizosphaerae TaxID=1872711 RepID=A0A4Q7KLA0_9PSEU|nr:protein phosphatase 2C domain-containing protein [Herbihabitans rhizosphaerae]RZS34706.1 serine/threonine protein phosphatase PrpC [Herbihabitans rhizosphaerae]
MTDLDLAAAGGTDAGLTGKGNYDVVHLSVDPLLAIVADGMGTGDGSAMAGKTAVETLLQHVRAAGDQVGPAEIRRALAAAHQEIGAFGQRIGALAGCTLTAIIESAHGFWIVQLGDSRIYRLRAGTLELLTVDHTMAWLGAVHGWYPFDSPQAAAARYHLLRYVGHPGAPDPDVMALHPRPGDVYLLCTDGISDQVDYHRIAGLLGAREEPATTVDGLIAAANAAGGIDNETAIVITVAGRVRR